MDKKLELKVDVINQLILYRNSTFKDKLCFVDENIQNAQRAKATKVVISTTENSVTFENDGAILEDPQKLFSMAESGWDDEVTKNENPFGLGFFSNITVSSNIEIYSGNYHIVFNVDKVISERNAKLINIDETEECYNGFKLVLNNFDFNTASGWSMRQRCELLGKYVHELDIIYNGETMKKIDLQEGDGDPNNFKLDGDGFVGWMRLSTGWGSKLAVYYKGRMVKYLENFEGVVGDVHITDKVLNLTAPDRKDIIKDAKYDEFTGLLKLYVEELCMRYIESGDESKIDELSDAIYRYVEPNKIADKLNFLVLNGKTHGDMIDKLIHIKETKYIQSFSDAQVYLKEGVVQPESHFEEVAFELEEQEIQVPNTESYYSGAGGSFVQGTPIVKEEEKVIVSGKEYFSKQQARFWVRLSELSDCKQKIAMIKYYSLPLIISRNKVEEKVLQTKEDAGVLMHVRDLEDSVKMTTTLTKTDLNKKEQRALMLLEMLSRATGFDRNIFAIGDLYVIRNFIIESLGIHDQMVLEDIKVVRNPELDKIYMDRSIIKQTHLRNDLFPVITIEDYRFLLSNLDVIATELGLILDKPVEIVYKSLINVLATAQ